ncbi:hypothetical protein ACQBAU_04850 [Propionibacteriaceae bacterium Y2011]
MTFRLIDRVAQALTALFAVAFVIVGVTAVLSLLQTRWLQLGVSVVMVLLFALLGWSELTRARSSLVIHEDSVTRTGSRGWSFPREEVTDATVGQAARGAPVLLRMRVQAATARQPLVHNEIRRSWWLARPNRDPRTVVLRVDPREVPPIRCALDLPAE